jgi:hypothetical protein
MSRTRRNPIALQNTFRAPRGHKKALSQECRKKAVPPNSWDDIKLSPETYLPEKAMKRMKKKGIPRDVAIERLRKKWNLSTDDAEKLAEYIYE